MLETIQKLIELGLGASTANPIVLGVIGVVVLALIVFGFINSANKRKKAAIAIGDKTEVAAVKHGAESEKQNKTDRDAGDDWLRN